MKEYADSNRSSRPVVSNDGRYVTFQGKRFSLGKARVRTSSKNPKLLKLELMQLEME